MLPLLLLLIISTFHVSGENGTAHLHKRQKRSLPIAINAENGKLLKEAVGWMTFRRDGVLMDDSQVREIFLEPVKGKYIRSKFYRTFVIAFRLGVLPRLTLNEGDACDPAYTMKYRDPYNNSVTWHYQKKFTFDSYDQRKSSKSQFCDYRQGLICKTTKRCGCPEGSVMQQIAPNSKMKRCVYKENEICNLIDMDHGNDWRHHRALASNLYHIIFNLEKPVGCKDGTQCRYIDKMLPRCYEPNKGPWQPPRPAPDTGHYYWPIFVGDECVIGLYADAGSCRTREQGVGEEHIIGALPGYVCNNFGLQRSIGSSNPGKEIRTGYCGHEWGRYGLGTHNKYSENGFRPFFITFVNPHTVPFRGKELRDYYRKYFTNEDCFKGFEVRKEGDRCSVSKTEKMEGVLKYFSDLDADAPPGQDYVSGATKTELNARLQSVIDMCVDVRQKICSIFRISTRSTEIALKCVKDSSTDKDGNDGTCQRRTNTDPLFDYAEKFIQFKELALEIEREQRDEDDSYRKDILKGTLEPPCLPALGMAPQSRTVTEVLEGGYCPDGSVCFQDYSGGFLDGKYGDNCALRESPPFDYVCHDGGDGATHSLCEKEWQDKLVSSELEKMVQYTYLARGKVCQYEIETNLRNKIQGGDIKINKYRILSWFEKSKKSRKSEGGLCDSSKLLECTAKGVCECIEKTEPRKVNIDTQEYQSDYCYSTEGSCNEDPTERMRLTDQEKEKFRNHYGNPSTDSLCNNGSVCLFLEIDTKQCTKQNTGKTGLDLVPAPPPPPGILTNPGKPGSDEGPGWLVAGASGTCSKILIILVSPLISVTTSQITNLIYLMEK